MDNLSWIDRHELIFVEEQGVEDNAPVSRAFFEEEDEATVCFVVHLGAGESEAAGYGDILSAHCARQSGVEIY